jgi:hypothetical protein
VGFFPPRSFLLGLHCLFLSKYKIVFVREKRELNSLLLILNEVERKVERERWKVEITYNIKKG